MRSLILWGINSLTLLMIPYMMDSIFVDTFWTALVAALILGLVNTLIRPVLILLTLPVTFISLGLFLFVVNGATFWLAAKMVDGFHVASFGAAIFGALIYSIATWALSTLILKES